MMFELRINNIIWSLYCEPAPSFTLKAQATTPSIYLYTHVLLALTLGFQICSPSPTYIPGLDNSEYEQTTIIKRLSGLLQYSVSCVANPQMRVGLKD